MFVLLFLSYLILSLVPYPSLSPPPRHSHRTKPFHKRQTLDSSKLKEFSDDNFKFNENGSKFFQKDRKH